MTSLPRTLLDVASSATVRQLEDQLSAARRLGLLDATSFRKKLEGTRGRRGAAELVRTLRLFEMSAAATRSELETRFLRLCAESGLPLPEVDVQIGNRFVDFLWRDQRLIAEVDGFRFHHHRFDEDRMRDIGQLVNGYRTVRITHRMMETDSGRLVGSLRRLLEEP